MQVHWCQLPSQALPDRKKEVAQPLLTHHLGYWEQVLHTALGRSQHALKVNSLKGCDAAKLRQKEIDSKFVKPPRVHLGSKRAEPGRF